jgi:hypothetical protein
MSQYLPTLSARGREEREEGGKKVKCVCVRARARVRPSVPMVRRGRETNGLVGGRLPESLPERACVRASERADGPETGCISAIANFAT